MDVLTDDKQNFIPEIERRIALTARRFLHRCKYHSYENDDLLQKGRLLALEMRDALAPMSVDGACVYFARALWNRYISDCAKIQRGKPRAPVLIFKDEYPPSRQPRVCDPDPADADLENVQRALIQDEIQDAWNSQDDRARMKLILEMASCGFNNSQIARHLGVSHEYVRQRVLRFIERARETAQTKGLA